MLQLHMIQVNRINRYLWLFIFFYACEWLVLNHELLLFHYVHFHFGCFWFVWCWFVGGSFIFKCLVVSFAGVWALFCYFQHLVIVDVYLSLEDVLLVALHLFQDLLIGSAFMQLFAFGLKSFIEILASIKIPMLLIRTQIIHIDWIPKLGQLQSHNTLLHGCDLIIVFLLLS